MNVLQLYRLRLAEAIKAGDTTPMMVFPIGEWQSAKYPSLPLTEDLANELIANFEAGVLGTEPVVDSSGKHDTSVPAAGWVKRVYLASYEEGTVSGLALWADVKWTTLGASLLTDEQYKYGSVEIGPVTLNDGGAQIDNVLRSLTLTNTPVLRIMPGVKDAAEKQRAIVTLSLSEFTLGDDEVDPVGEILDDMDALAAKVDAAMKGKKGMPSVRTMMREARAKLSAHKLAEPGSFNALRDSLEAAIGEAHGERIWVCDFGPEWVVYEQGGLDDVSHTYKAAYGKTESGITLGDPVEVKRETTYVPVSDGAPGAGSGSSSPADALGMAVEGTPAALAEDPAAQRGADHHMDPKTLKTLKLAEGADDAAIDAAVLSLAEERDAAVTKLAETEKKATLDAVTVKLDEKIGGAFIAPGERDAYLKLAETDAAQATAMIEARTAKVIDLTERGSGGEDGSQYADATVELDEKSKARAVKDGIKIADAQKLVLTEDADLAKRYSEFRLNPRREA